MRLLNFLKKAALPMLMIMIIAAGCSSDDPAASGSMSDSSSVPSENSDVNTAEEQSTPEVSTEPVTLGFYANVGLSNEEFELFFKEPVENHFPNITLVKMEGSLDEMIAAKEIPDIIFSDNDWHMPLKELRLPADISDLVEKFEIDLDKFIPETVAAIRNLDPEGQRLEGIPVWRNVGTMFYNKDIFDLFGVSYPVDDMLYSEVLDKARLLTREADGIQYIGFDPRFPNHMVSPYTQPFIDPETEKPLIDIPLYRKVLEVFVQNYNIPGVVVENSYAYATGTFLEQQRLAMMPEWVSKVLNQLDKDAQDLPNFDIVTEPRFEDRVGYGRHTLANMLIITETSEHKEQAMQVLKYMVSEESQMRISSHSRIPALKGKQYEEAYGSNNPKLKDLNLAALFKHPSSPTPPPHPFDKEVQKIIRDLRKELALNNKDINTALKEAQELAEQTIAAMKLERE